MLFRVHLFLFNHTYFGTLAIFVFLQSATSISSTFKHFSELQANTKTTIQLWLRNTLRALVISVHLLLLYLLFPIPWLYYKTFCSPPPEAQAPFFWGVASKNAPHGKKTISPDLKWQARSGVIMQIISISKHEDLVFHNGELFTRYVNQNTGSVTISKGCYVGDRVEFPSGNSVWNPTRTHIEVLFGEEIFSLLIKD